MSYYLHNNDKYIKDEYGKKTTVHLIKRPNLKSAKDLGSDLVQSIPNFVGFVYPAFELNGEAYLALAKPEEKESLDSLLSSSSARKLLYNGNQMSPLYKTIIKSLLIVTGSLLKVNLRCNLDRSNIFIVAKDLSKHVEVVDFWENDKTRAELLDELRNFVKNINIELGKGDGECRYKALEDEGMNFLLRQMGEPKNMGETDFSKMAKLPVFWDWVMMKNLICKVRRLCNKKFKNYTKMKQVCKDYLPGWHEKVRKDAYLSKLLKEYLDDVKKYSDKTDKDLLEDDRRCIQFLAVIIKHFHLIKTSNIPSLPAVLQKIEEVLGEGFLEFGKE